MAALVVRRKRTAKAQEATTLDETDTLPFYYRIEKYDKIYAIPYKFIHWFPLFHNMIKESPTQSRKPEHALTIAPILHTNDKGVRYIINDISHHDYIEKYIATWELDAEREKNTVSHISTGNPESCLAPRDLNLIKEYIQSLNIAAEESSVVYKYKVISGLTPLIETISSFLMSEAAIYKKLIQYVAVLVRNCGLLELEEIVSATCDEEITHFKQMQEQKITQWMQDNGRKIYESSASPSTGSG